ncbi:MAG: Protein translocase subunit SecF [Parcubacteria group bacterium GW2011_GWF2_39_13b]|nr:MAG: Protein translocase subunit SecF [Parcubacteria group bacterium GW2011_GWF2_39_13b]
MNIIKYRTIYFSFSAILFIASIIFLSIWGLKLGNDFTGGSLLEVNFSGEMPSNQAIKDKLVSLNLGDINIQPSENQSVILRLKDVDEQVHQDILKVLGSVEEKRFETIGPVVGQELKTRALYAIALTLLAIVLYIAWAFRKVSRPIASWKYGVATLIALMHDVIIPVGFFAALGHFYGIEVGLLFVTAVLTILGFSVHDTIVVFDRIRENLRKGGSKNFEETVDKSINQTLTRSINTSLTVVLTLLAVYFFGGQTIKYFTLALLIGVIFGTYSSIFIASPVLVAWEKRSRRK